MSTTMTKETTPTPPPAEVSNPATVAEVAAYFRETIFDEATTAEDHKAMFRRVVASLAHLEFELRKRKVADLSRMYGWMSNRDFKKDELVERVLVQVQDDFALDKDTSLPDRGYVISHHSDWEKVERQRKAQRLAKIAAAVESITDEDLRAYRVKVAEARADREAKQEEHARVVANPTTLEEFETAIYSRGRAALIRDKVRVPKGRGKSDEINRLIYRAGIKELTDPELERYDALVADRARAKRGEELVKRATVRRVEISDGNYMEILKTWHGKHNCDVWLVVLAEREEAETFLELCEAARKLRGNYSRQWGDRPGGFQFFDEAQADKFVLLQSQDIFELGRLERLIARRERVRGNAVAHFEALADRMEERADYELTRDRKVNTERRIMLAERAMDRAHDEQAMAGTLRAHARALLDRTAKYLDRIRWRTHAETFSRILDGAGGRVALVEYPWPRVPAYSLKNIAEQIKEREGSIMVSRRILKMVAEQGEVVEFRGDRAADVLRHFYRRARLHRVRGWELDRVRQALADYKRLKLNNVDTLPELRAALREHMGRRVEVDMHLKDRVMRDQYPGQYPPDYFPTPLDVVEYMIELAMMEDGLKVLEPSAGMGHIANALRAQYGGCDFYLVELSGLLCDALRAQGWGGCLMQADFLATRAPRYFDRILMNPPFGIDGTGTDIKHVRHAYTMLAEGGRLVAVMSDGVFYRGDPDAQEFRAWLDEVGGERFELPEGSFLSGDRPTAWACSLVVIDRVQMEVAA